MKSKNYGTIAILIGAVILLIFIISLIGFSKPLIVLSGSMQPVMMTGDIILVSPIEPEDVKVLDIIAFTSKYDSIITHRVLSISEDESGLIFQTKGDANEDADDFIVSEAKLIGKAVFVIPFIGYLPELTKNPKIFFVLVIVPASIIIIDEILSIIKYSNPLKLRKMEKEEKKATPRISRIVNHSLLGAIASVGMIVALIISLPFIIASGYTPTPATDYNIENDGVITCSYTLLPLGVDNIPSEHGFIKPGNETSISFDEKIKCVVSLCPAIVPVFWVEGMMKINTALPCLFLIVLSIIAITIISVPLWYKKPRCLNRKKPR